MTDAINFFQSLFTLRSFAPAAPAVTVTSGVYRLATSLKSDARFLASIGDEEKTNGTKSQALAFGESDKSKRKMFAEITMWHHGHALESYRRSAQRFDEAARIQTGKTKAFQVMAKEMRNRARQVEISLNQLHELLENN